MKKLLIDGNLGKDAEVLTSKGGKTYVRLAVGNRVYSKDGESTDWIDVYSFDPNVIENRASKLLKGARVLVQGDCFTGIKVYNGQAYINTKVMADFIEVINGAKKTDVADAPSTYTATTADNSVKHEVKANPEPVVAAAAKAEDDDLPF